MTDRRTRILLVDEQALMRAGIALLLALEPDMEVVAEAANGDQACTLALKHRPSIVLMDLNVHGNAGCCAISRIKKLLPTTKVVVLTDSTDPNDIARALRCGADGYLLKSLEPQALAAHIREAACGRPPIDGAVVRQLLNALQAAEGPDLIWEPPAGKPVPQPELHPVRPRLTVRELDVLRLMARGASNSEIGAMLSVSENTVKNHVKRILIKLKVENRVQATAWAIANGLLPG